MRGKNHICRYFRVVILVDLAIAGHTDFFLKIAISPADGSQTGADDKGGVGRTNFKIGRFCGLNKHGTPTSQF